MRGVHTRHGESEQTRTLPFIRSQDTMAELSAVMEAVLANPPSLPRAPWFLPYICEAVRELPHSLKRQGNTVWMVPFSFSVSSRSIANGGQAGDGPTQGNGRVLAYTMDWTGTRLQVRLLGLVAVAVVVVTPV